VSEKEHGVDTVPLEQDVDIVCNAAQSCPRPSLGRGRLALAELVAAAGERIDT